jgi:hypothetical protein
VILFADITDMEDKEAPLVETCRNNPIVIRGHNDVNMILNREAVLAFGFNADCRLRDESLQDTLAGLIASPESLVCEEQDAVLKVLIKSAYELVRACYLKEVIAENTAVALRECAFSGSSPALHHDRDLGSLTAAGPGVLYDVGHPIDQVSMVPVIAAADDIVDVPVVNAPFPRLRLNGKPPPEIIITRGAFPRAEHYPVVSPTLFMLKPKISQGQGLDFALTVLHENFLVSVSGLKIGGRTERYIRSVKNRVYNLIHHYTFAADHNDSVLSVKLGHIVGRRLCPSLYE